MKKIMVVVIIAVGVVVMGYANDSQVMRSRFTWGQDMFAMTTLSVEAGVNGDIDSTEASHKGVLSEQERVAKKFKRYTTLSRIGVGMTIVSVPLCLFNGFLLYSYIYNMVSNQYNSTMFPFIDGIIGVMMVGNAVNSIALFAVGVVLVAVFGTKYHRLKTQLSSVTPEIAFTQGTKESGSGVLSLGLRVRL